MPQALKVALIALGAFVLVVVCAGVVGTIALKRTWKTFERSTTSAQTAGESFGRSSTSARCVGEAVRRSGGCNGSAPCGMLVHSFLWSCLEAAPYDAAYCRQVPDSGSDREVTAWAEHTCGVQGYSGRTECTMGIHAAAAYCSYRESTG